MLHISDTRPVLFEYIFGGEQEIVHFIFYFWPKYLFFSQLVSMNALAGAVIRHNYCHLLIIVVLLVKFVLFVTVEMLMCVCVFWAQLRDSLCSVCVWLHWQLVCSLKLHSQGLCECVCVCYSSVCWSRCLSNRKWDTRSLFVPNVHPTVYNRKSTVYKPCCVFTRLKPRFRNH